MRKSFPLFILRQIPDPDLYKALQEEGNRRKFDTHSAEMMYRYLTPLSSQIANLPLDEVKILCHGIRNGSELKGFIRLVEENGKDCDLVLGTDISVTAKSVEYAIQHDFHEPIENSQSKFHIVFSNSLDQSNQPEKAIKMWLSQLDPRGVLILGWSEAHGKLGLSNLDPFACETELFPFLFLLWSDGLGYIERFIPDHLDRPRRGFFVIRKML